MKTIALMIRLDVSDDADIDELMKDVEDALDTYEGWCHGSGWRDRPVEVLLPEEEVPT